MISTTTRVALLLLLAVMTTACSGDFFGGAAACADPIEGAPTLCPIPVEQRNLASTDAIMQVRDDAELSIDVFEGQVVVLNFWASWCGPCRAEQPLLNAIHETLDPVDALVLGVNVIDDSRTNARAHLREFDVQYANLYDPDASYAASYGGIGARTIPTTIILDREGRIALRIFGEINTPGEIIAAANHIAAESSA